MSRHGFPIRGNIILTWIWEDYPIRVGHYVSTYEATTTSGKT